MSSTDYNYDEQGQFFPYFILTLTGLVTLPLTYSLLSPPKKLENTAPRISSNFKPKNEDLIQAQKRKQLRKERRVKRFIAVVVGWAIIGWMIYLIIVTARTLPKIYDPYEILGVSRSADEKAISRHYKRMSLIYHPDKIRPDPAKNETIDDLNERFVELTKAYKALTDEEVRNNYLQYGHPDGKQSYSIGIALPKLIITEGMGKYVLLVYGGLLGVLLPYIVGKWWYGSQRYTREKVLIASAGNMFREYKEDMIGGRVISTLSTGEEYKELLKGSRSEDGLAKVEKKVMGIDEKILTAKDREVIRKLDDSTRRKALSLLWAYLNRTDLEDTTLEQEKYEAGAIGLALNESFTAITLAFGNLLPVIGAYRSSQNLIQAIAPGSSPLLQLPHFTPEVVKSVEGVDAKTHLSVQKYMEIPEEKRRALTVGPGLLSAEQYKAATNVAKQLPYFVISKAFFKVMGERFITPSSLVQLVIKGRIIPPGYTASAPEVNELDLEDIDPEEGDLDALHNRNIGKTRKVACLLADPKQGKIAVPPFTFTTFDKPIFDEEGKPTFNVQTLKMQFQAPPQVGDFTFALHLISDSYMGFDIKKEITLHIDDPAKAAAVEEEDDISEPDEDSIAGQMQALKTGVPPPKKKTKRPSDEESDEESDTEGEVDDTSETDTETDTDGE
uniref:Translocation protein sec63 n=1 Tax=Talaromyces marneffei PM1 TaxID=1077442 RepID=A0A093V7V8_TALMA